MTTELLNTAQSLFFWMLALSLQVAVILLIRKPLARYFGTTVAYRLWLLPLLWLPLQGMDWSQFGWSLPALSWGSTTEVQGTVSWFPMIARSFEAVLDFPEQAFSLDNTGSNSIWLAVALLWFGVAGVLITRVLLKMWHFSRQLPGLSTNCSATPDTTRKHAPFPSAVPIRTIAGLGSPALYGVLRPQLLLPADFELRYNASQRSLILAHEAVHYRRRDNLWNLLACSLRLLFWFN
ncbi:MAG TPA: M56 family metallopeptidase, partial [Pseudomonadaceae bacterium]|nr:M56 family metallopeptidase [Pseudomonadaceae bacterium]